MELLQEIFNRLESKYMTMPNDTAEDMARRQGVLEAMILVNRMTVEYVQNQQVNV